MIINKLVFICNVQIYLTVSPTCVCVYVLRYRYVFVDDVKSILYWSYVEFDALDDDSI